MAELILNIVELITLTGHTGSFGAAVRLRQRKVLVLVQV